MKRILTRRPSPAVIIAIVALVVALTGTAVAGGGFLTKKKFKKTAVQRLTYVNNTVTVTSSDGSGTDAKLVSATCPSGQHPVGGGVKLSPTSDDLWWDDGYLTATGYASKVFNYITPASNATGVVTVACVTGKASGAPTG
jgi:hypothetical protein